MPRKTNPIPTDDIEQHEEVQAFLDVMNALCKREYTGQSRKRNAGRGLTVEELHVTAPDLAALAKIGHATSIKSENKEEEKGIATSMFAEEHNMLKANKYLINRQVILESLTEDG